METQKALKIRILFFMLVLVYPLLQSCPVNALPAGCHVTTGNAQISLADPKNMTIEQTTHKIIINWDSFSIAQQECMTFIQPNIEAVALIRVSGIAPSTINGSLNANGRIFLINNNGLVVGPSGNINGGHLWEVHWICQTRISFQEITAFFRIL